jgi:hypothetical protein
MPSFLSLSISQAIAFLLRLRLSVQLPVGIIPILPGWRIFSKSLVAGEFDSHTFEKHFHITNM